MSTTHQRIPINYWRPGLRPEEVDELQNALTDARDALRTLIPHSMNPGRQGAQVTFARQIEDDQSTGGWRLVYDASAPVGLMPPERFRTYYAISREKARRLHHNWILHQHRTSYLSRREGTGRYGGAVQGQHRIVSVSGLEEFDDEALAMIVMVQRAWLAPREATELSSCNGNPQFYKLWDRYINIGPLYAAG